MWLLCYSELFRYFPVPGLMASNRRLEYKGIAGMHDRCNRAILSLDRGRETERVRSADNNEGVAAFCSERFLDEVARLVRVLYDILPDHREFNTSHKKLGLFEPRYLMYVWFVYHRFRERFLPALKHWQVVCTLVLYRRVLRESRASREIPSSE